ncbi:hypothetical protein DOTSEDRAFT_72204 [Dothistroma septosporum NZE10]|uniref:Uncharacterized protein n=1 Tax=Dothistroma septosporum (strain NZE10 / CBS 128990) TaxID=675120 RepID=N1PQP2_DOTSN|nr:hypothetical protein DOTSEDRAFT_72204 [Dothistroma septosporum NZE10]
MAPRSLQGTGARSHENLTAARSNFEPAAGYKSIMRTVILNSIHQALHQQVSGDKPVAYNPPCPAFISSPPVTLPATTHSLFPRERMNSVNFPRGLYNKQSEEYADAKCYDLAFRIVMKQNDADKDGDSRAAGSKFRQIAVFDYTSRPGEQ